MPKAGQNTSSTVARKGTPLPGGKVRGSETGRPVMALLDLASRRWLLRIVWELRHGPLKFRPLQAACDEVSPSLLNRRLKELREARLLELSAEGYRLTELGHGLHRAFAPISVWAEGWAKALGRHAAER
jgi:DNA-binding HxlR family transcriptional regulator